MNQARRRDLRPFFAHARQQRRFDVVFYTPTIAPLLFPGSDLPPGGAETQILLLAKELALSGLRVGLVTHRISDDMPEEINGVSILPRPLYVPHSPLVGKIKEAFKILYTLYRADAAVVVKRSYGVDVGLVGLYALLARRRFVYSSANIVDFGAEKLLTKRRDLELFHLGVRLADEVVVQTEEQLALCRSSFDRDAVLIKSVGVDVPDAMLEPSSFLWIGRIIDYKRPLEFVRLAESLPEARFTMVGVPSPNSAAARILQAEVESAASSLSNLDLLSPRPRAELAPLINSAVAMVNTSEYEGMPNVLLEGWARGIPALVLAHDPGGVVEGYQLGGFANGSFERFASLAGEMWAMRHDRNLLAERCRSYIRREHAPEIVVAQWRSVIDRHD